MLTIGAVLPPADLVERLVPILTADKAAHRKWTDRFTVFRFQRPLTAATVPAVVFVVFQQTSTHIHVGLLIGRPFVCRRERKES